MGNGGNDVLSGGDGNVGMLKEAFVNSVVISSDMGPPGPGDGC